MIAQTAEVREAHRFDVAALERYLRAHVEGFSGSLEVRQFRGGQSNPTYHVSAGGREYVLRRKPPGKLLPSAHAVDREYRVITALGKAGFPVPRTFALCEDDSVIGTAFYVMDCVHGRIFIDPAIPSVTPRERRAIYESLIDVLARLHTADWQALGLADFGRPGNYFARQIGRWTNSGKSISLSSPGMRRRPGCGAGASVARCDSRSTRPCRRRRATCSCASSTSAR